MNGCRIGKVTCKRTGKVLSVISPKLADWDQVDVLQCALQKVREGKALAVGVFVKTADSNYSDYTGRYDALVSGSANLSYRINKGWDEAR